MKPSVNIVGADKGGVGKTTVSRTLLDYFRWKQIPIKPFDGQWPGGNLYRFNPADIINFADINGQMKAFDGLNECPNVLLDLPAGMATFSLDAMDRAKLTQEVAKDRMSLNIFHIVGSNMASINEIADIRARMGVGTRYFLVKNYAHKDADYFDWDKDNAVRAVLEAHPEQVITIPHLEGAVYERIEKLGGSFFDHGAGKWTWMQGTIQGWCEAVWAEYDRVGLAQVVTG